MQLNLSVCDSPVNIIDSRNIWGWIIDVRWALVLTHGNSIFIQNSHVHHFMRSDAINSSEAQVPWYWYTGKV